MMGLRVPPRFCAADPLPETTFAFGGGGALCLRTARFFGFLYSSPCTCCTCTIQPCPCCPALHLLPVIRCPALLLRTKIALPVWSTCLCLRRH